MQRFFFDFRQNGVHAPDDYGIMFHDVEQAYLEAHRAAQEMWSELLKQRKDPRHCIFEVRNNAGEVLFLFPFQEVMECCTDRKAIPLRLTFDELADTSSYAKRISSEFAEEIRSLRQSLQDSRILLQERV